MEKEPKTFIIFDKTVNIKKEYNEKDTYCIFWDFQCHNKEWIPRMTWNVYIRHNIFVYLIPNEKDLISIITNYEDGSIDTYDYFYENDVEVYRARYYLKKD